MGHGFLGYHASFMLDVVVCALVVVVPVLLISVYLVKFRRRYLWHRNIQVGLGIVLLLTVAAFEYDLRSHGGWEQIVNPDAQHLRVAGADLEFVRRLLWVHLIFAVSTPFLWGATILLALRRFASPPFPGPHSWLHKRLGWASAIDISLTSVTGLLFYYFAFVAG